MRKPLSGGFYFMTKTEKRIAVAKDVLKQIKARKYAVTAGTYCNINITCKDVGKDLQRVIKKQTEPCEVCAIGSLFLSKINLFNNYVLDEETISKSWIGNDIDLNFDSLQENLEDLWTSREFKIMEMTFEGKDIDCMFDDSEGKDEKLIDATFAFYEKYSDPEDRLIAIMQNIIKNKGKFKL